MATAQKRETKVERLEVRLTPSAKSLLTHAAQVTHTTLTEFLVSSAVNAAQDVLVAPRVFGIGSEEGWRSLLGLLDESSPEQPSPELVDLLGDDAEEAR